MVKSCEIPIKSQILSQFFGWISIESLRFQLQHLPVPTSWHLQSGRALLWVGVLGLAEDNRLGVHPQLMESPL
jgi:hypothetical protein